MLESPTDRSYRQCQAAYFEANNRIHGENNSKRAPHPPFSPDLVPSDFLLFGYIQAKLQEVEFMEKDNLLAEIHEVLDGMSGKALKPVLIE
jgi:hypothetical protein